MFHCLFLNLRINWLITMFPTSLERLDHIYFPVNLTHKPFHEHFQKECFGKLITRIHRFKEVHKQDYVVWPLGAESIEEGFDNCNVRLEVLDTVHQSIGRPANLKW